MKNRGVKVVIVILLVIGLAQVIPEIVNTLLVLVLASMLIMQSGQFAKLIQALEL